MKIYSQEYKLAGSIDMIFINNDKTFTIYDWKRCKDITETSFGNKCSTTECISHLPDSNMWHYSLQTNIYKKILENDYDMTVSDMFLVCLHPSKSDYQVIKVPELNSEINDLFHLRKSQLL